MRSVPSSSKRTSWITRPSRWQWPRRKRQRSHWISQPSTANDAPSGWMISSGLSRTSPPVWPRRYGPGVCGVGMPSVSSTSTTSAVSIATIACRPPIGCAYWLSSGVGRCHIGVQNKRRPSSRWPGTSMPNGQVSMCTWLMSSMPRRRRPSRTRGSLLAAAMHSTASGPSSAAFWPGCGSQRRTVPSRPTTLSISRPSARSQTVMRAARSIGSPVFHAFSTSFEGSSSSVKTNRWF